MSSIIQLYEWPWKDTIKRASENFQYLDLCALAEIINGLPLKFSHFHHPTILGSLQSIVKLAMGWSVQVTVGNYLRGVWTLRFFIRVQTTKDVKSSSKTREVGINNRIPAWWHRSRYRRCELRNLPFSKVHPHAKVPVSACLCLHSSHQRSYQQRYHCAEQLRIRIYVSMYLKTIQYT